MNKLAQYLNQHLVGEVTTDPTVLAKYGTDQSPLTIIPQMVAFAHSVNDIRKLLRFTWQLAEKGHQLPLTVRGGGAGVSGGALGSGIVLSVREHINATFEYDPKQRLLRLQPGATASGVQNALGLYGDSLPFLDEVAAGATVGGWIAEEAVSYNHVKELEVVLANGDLLHTRRLSKRELGKKKGEQSFEADIYRAIDTLLEDSAEAVDKIRYEDSAGFSGLTMVKDKDGSFDLTPLFIGNQGSLGVISEVIISAQQAPENQTIVLAAFDDMNDARDVLDEIEKFKPTKVEFIGRTILERAQATGKTHEVLNEQTQALVVVTLQTGSLRHQTKRAKKLRSMCEQHNARTNAEDEQIDTAVVEGIIGASLRANDGEGELITVANGAYVPLVRFEEFAQALDELAKKRRVSLMLSGEPLEGKWTIRAHAKLSTVGGKQLVFKLIEDCADCIATLDGSLVYSSSEGRMGSVSVYKRLDPEVVAIFDEVKKIFDPHNTLNNGVKQNGDIKELAKQLSSK